MSAELRASLLLPAPEAAPALLGCTLTHTTAEGNVRVEITEVEAYAGALDPASHAYRGPTARNAAMFGPPGFAYVYFSYGMHWCLNVVTGPAGTPSAVLIRAGRVLEGEELARSRRGPATRERALARGPACLTQALGIDRTSAGLDLLAGEAGLTLARAGRPRELTWSAGPRVGVSAASDVAWRFWLTGDPTVSAYRRSPRA